MGQKDRPGGRGRPAGETTTGSKPAGPTASGCSTHLRHSSRADSSSMCRPCRHIRRFRSSRSSRTPHSQPAPWQCLSGRERTQSKATMQTWKSSLKSDRKVNQCRHDVCRHGSTGDVERLNSARPHRAPAPGGMELRLPRCASPRRSAAGHPTAPSPAAAKPRHQRPRCHPNARGYPADRAGRQTLQPLEHSAAEAGIGTSRGRHHRKEPPPRHRWR